jgi:hypothetical protein
MPSCKNIKLDFESNKKLEKLSEIIIDLYNNPSYSSGKNFVLELANCLGIQSKGFSFILNSKFKKNAG